MSEKLYPPTLSRKPRKVAAQWIALYRDHHPYKLGCAQQLRLEARLMRLTKLAKNRRHVSPNSY